VWLHRSKAVSSLHLSADVQGLFLTVVRCIPAAAVTAKFASCIQYVSNLLSAVNACMSALNSCVAFVASALQTMAVLMRGHVTCSINLNFLCLMSNKQHPAESSNSTYNKLADKRSIIDHAQQLQPSCMRVYTSSQHFVVRAGSR
jgi:hypothetical protein